VMTAGLRVCAREERSVLPCRSLMVAGWMLERDA
jgi:hypothetical protein